MNMFSADCVLQELPDTNAQGNEHIPEASTSQKCGRKHGLYQVWHKHLYHLPALGTGANSQLAYL